MRVKESVRLWESVRARVRTVSFDIASDIPGASVRVLVRLDSLVMASVRVVESEAVLIRVRLRSRVSVMDDVSMMPFI